MGGAILTEHIFAWPGLGRLALDSLYNNDFPLLTGSVLMITLLYLVAYFISDIIYVILDPRIRLN